MTGWRRGGVGLTLTGRMRGTRGRLSAGMTMALRGVGGLPLREGDGEGGWIPASQECRGTGQALRAGGLGGHIRGWKRVGPGTGNHKGCPYGRGTGREDGFLGARGRLSAGMTGAGEGWGCNHNGWDGPGGRAPRKPGVAGNTGRGAGMTGGKRGAPPGFPAALVVACHP